MPNYDPGLRANTQEGYTMIRRADGSGGRDWWAGDHLWHVDGTRHDSQPIYTVIACQEADQGSPGTELIDTVELYEQSVTDGFWERHSIPAAALPTLRSVFVDATYYREALPFMQALASQEDAALIDQRVARDLEKSDSQTLPEHADKNEQKHPAKRLPLIQRTPLNRLESIFLDGGGRNASLSGQSGEDYKEVLHAFRQTYLANHQPHERGLVRSIGWAANTCLILPQVGTLHRALPGNNHNRALHLGFLIEAPTA
jgi:alpha-ketoglutarate-dependent taurine dioxygenase